MRWRNSSSAFGWPSIVLHWGLALALVANFLLGDYMVGLDYYDSLYHRAPEWHKLAGIIIASLMLLRWLWNRLQPRPQDLSPTPRANRMAHLLHSAFYLLVILLFVTGYLIATGRGQGIELWFGWQLPAWQSGDWPYVDQAGELHEWLAWGLIFSASIHALAALYHHFYKRDRTLLRLFGRP